MAGPIRFDNSYARLPERFYSHQAPAAVSEPKLIRINHPLAEELGISGSVLGQPESVRALAGSAVFEGSEPLAQAYAGHQFGGFVPQLGDGRALLLGEVIDRKGRRRDIQLKGSGPTPYSRRGDGRAALGPVLREYIVSEAMAALGVPTTRSLAAVLTGDPVYRETVLPGAVLTRVAASHIRVGTFQYFAARGDEEALRILADYVIARHYPVAEQSANRYGALLDHVVEAQARLIAHWMCLGFIHGVMNTDNMTVSGETIDYGPCAFMDSFHPNTVLSSIDTQGRYAYGAQPRIGQWNLTRFAETLLPILSSHPAEAEQIAHGALALYGPTFNEAYLVRLRQKLGLAREEEGDQALITALFTGMMSSEADFTLTFRTLWRMAAGHSDDNALKAFPDAAAQTEWLRQWQDRLSREPSSAIDRLDAMRLANPAVIARNHRVEEAIRAGEDRTDFGPFERLLDALSRPFDERPEIAAYEAAPMPEERVTRTFCGT